MTNARNLSAAPRARRGIQRDERGVAAVEFAVLLPMILAILTGGIVMWDAFRFAEMTERSAFTMSDLLSRQLVAGPDLMNDLHATHFALLNNRTDKVQTRMASVEVYTVTEDDPETAEDETVLGTRVAWHWDSRTKTMTKPQNLDISDMPMAGSGDSVLLVETKAFKRDFIQTLKAGDREYGDRIWVRPRYVGQMVWN